MQKSFGEALQDPASSVHARLAGFQVAQDAVKSEVARLVASGVSAESAWSLVLFGDSNEEGT